MTKLTNFPRLVHFSSDDTTVEFVMELKQQKDDRQAQYKYTKVGERSPNLGKTFVMKLDQLEHLINDKLANYEQ